MEGTRGVRRTEPPADFEVFCRAEYSPLVRTMDLYCGNRFVAEELAQEALVRACSHWSKVKKMEHREAWLRRVAINLANSQFRRKSAERRATARLMAEPRAPHLDPDASSSIPIRKALATLTRRQRAVIVLRFFDDLTFRQIAEVMGCSDNTAKSLARRALAVLRSHDQIEDMKEGLDAVSPS